MNQRARGQAVISIRNLVDQMAATALEDTNGARTFPINYGGYSVTLKRTVPIASLPQELRTAVQMYQEGAAAITQAGYTLPPRDVCGVAEPTVTTIEDDPAIVADRDLYFDRRRQIERIRIDAHARITGLKDGPTLRKVLADVQATMTAAASAPDIKGAR